MRLAIICCVLCGCATDPALPPAEDDPTGTPVEGTGEFAEPDGGAPAEDAGTADVEGPATAAPDGPGFAAPTDDPCTTLTPTIRGTDRGETLIGTDGADVILAGAGDDVIWGNGGDDVICAGGGADRIEGGAGNDYLDAGFGRDFADGGAGNDLLHGGSGGDLIRGSWGDDVLFGDLLDDELYGDGGDDLLVGGHGIDHMHGGEDDDWLRGDTNKDYFTGGAGNDTATFMTATPPGQPLGSLERVEGILVDNRDLRSGRASGDGYLEPLVGVEHVVGSPFSDRILASSKSGEEEIAGRGDGAFVALATGPIDLGLVVLGSRGWADDALAVAIADGVVTVRATNGAALTAGAGCRGTSAAEVRCVLESELRFVVGWGGGGNDTIVLEGGGFPRDMTTTLDGGEGDDTLGGHAGQDILFAGRTGNDTLGGHGGDDALLSESMDADDMDAGGGNDQLVANHPCAGHRFIGGGGIDVGGFARVGTRFATAEERHRQRIHAQIGYRAYQPAFCARDGGTRLENDIEILEGAGGDDELVGNDGDNTIWGWGGDDVIRGLGGNDTIEGHAGNDTIYGGAGSDRLRGNRGFNVLHARDGEREAELSCGSDGRLETADAIDPGSSGCR